MDFFLIICDSNDGYKLDLILSIKRYTLLANSDFFNVLRFDEFVFILM